jgi:hypothetical protein
MKDLTKSVVKNERENINDIFKLKNSKYNIGKWTKQEDEKYLTTFINCFIFLGFMSYTRCTEEIT